MSGIWRQDFPSAWAKVLDSLLISRQTSGVNQLGMVLRRHWGLGLLCLVFVFSSHRILSEPFPGHYRVFVSAGRAFWQGAPAYATDFGTGVGFWFYSPLCGLAIFGPLSLLPEKFGLALFLAGSFLAYVWGGRACGSALAGRDQGQGSAARDELAMNLFWGLSCAPILIAVVTSKVEILIVGLLLWAAAGLLRGRDLFWPAVLAAVVTNWKFQPLPTILLWAIVLWQSRGVARFALGFFFGLLSAFGLPFLVLPAGYLYQAHQLWMSSLQSFTQESWLNFENVFSFLGRVVGTPPSWDLARLISAVAALGLACVVLVWGSRARRAGLPLSEARFRGLLLAGGLGAAYAVAFSPLGQNNAIIVCAPLLLWASWSAVHGPGGRAMRRALIVLLALVLVVPYSDLLPLEARQWCHAYAVKPVLLLACAILLSARWLADAKTVASSTQA